MLQLSGEKMSKSIGNLVTIEEFLANHPADALRMLVLNSGYRNPLSYSEEILSQAQKAIDRLRSGLNLLYPPFLVRLRSRLIHWHARWMRPMPGS